ncbi:methyltransferase [Streptomyces pluripotens]|uniref:Protein-L-isoaspartate O-methyltransferase n=1 Tax=Streptomyces pluripotens TaxID=1355015 RepID=A0A221NWY5_9ACTN|nr:MULTISPECIES: methyltransferase domain-containing protein [Streptomyces]ARP70265.1 methyltransferase [Streptomyces pluripotens]ASN24523.1 methyltransferase [Streptomyces pluripotens]KIE28045.1 methyltransferase [Streptomyces sp. MUSC 125]MCH0558364.1 methyltransferase domain-containing protein [Streptomyces sp. MUM 16J]
MGAYDAEIESLAAAGRAALVREIDAEGTWAADPVWRKAFAEVPRHLFVPYYYVAGRRGYERRWGESADPEDRERWVRGVYADVPLATRLRDGELLSSSSQPSLMARMLVALCVTDGDRVLEVGAGTGYNAALLTHRLGDGDLVTTVDLDPEIAESARGHLAAAGYRPVVVTGDGARGVPERAPFDRVIATCELATVPRAWLAQCRPGARILTPLATGLAALTLRDPERAEGHFLPTPAYFVPLRGEGRVKPEEVSLAGLPGRAREQELFRFLLALTRGTLTAQEAYVLWEREGEPSRERYGVTVTPERTWAWLDDPVGPYAWPLPGQSQSPVLP